MSTHVSSRKHNNTLPLTVSPLQSYTSTNLNYICCSLTQKQPRNRRTEWVRGPGKLNVSCKNCISVYRRTNVRSAHLAAAAAFSVIQWAHPKPPPSRIKCKAPGEEGEKKTERQRGHNLTFLFSGGGGDYFPLLKVPSRFQVWRGSRLPLCYS